MICSLCCRVISQQSNRKGSMFLRKSGFQPVRQQYRCFYENPKTAFDSEKKSKQRAEEFDKAIVKQSYWFEQTGSEEKSKETFQRAIGLFVQRNVHRRGHVEFIYAAMKRMKEYGVHKDLESYKKLIEIFPKGKMIGKNLWQIDFMHYPKHQQCCIDVLDELSYQG